jgi:hypothetical protein
MNMDSKTCLTAKTGYSPGMVTKAIACLIAGTLIMVLAGCSPREEKVDGSIFIVTQGGENFKLGLVTVSFFSQQQIEPYLTKITFDFDKTRKELKKQQESLNEKHTKAILARDVLEQQYKQAKDLADETLQKIGGDSITRPEFSALNETLLESEVAERDKLQRKINESNTSTGISDTNSAVAKMASSDAYLKSFHQENVKRLERQKQKTAEMQTNWDSLKPAYLKQVDKKNRLYQAWQKASDQPDAYAKSLATVTGRLESWLTEQPQAYFNNLPTALAVTKTDADGKFSLQLPQKGEFILAAQAQRLVSNNTEKYFWLIRIHPDGKSVMQVMLSNDNLITVNSSESAVRFPTP